MAKLTNVQTKIEIDKKDGTSFEVLKLFVQVAAAQGPEQFWRRYEILKTLKDVPVGEEREFTSDQTKDLKEIINGRRYGVDEETAFFLESVKPVLA